MLQRVRQGAPATIRVVWDDQDGQPVDVTGPVTVTVTRASAAAVLTGAPTVHGTTGVYTAAVPVAATAQLDTLTAVWTDTSTGAARTTTVEVAGGFFFSLADARNSDDTLLDASKYPDADVARRRTEVEVECEEICDRAFVPRHRRVVLDGTGNSEITLPNSDVRRIRAVTVTDDSPAGVPYALTSTELSYLATVGTDGLIRRGDRGLFLEGVGNVIVEYEHGWDSPPEDLWRASLTRLRYRLNSNKTAVPDRATQFTAVEGGTYQLDTAAQYKTGQPDVDAAYQRWGRRDLDGTTDFPVSRPLVMSSQYFGLYHGGNRL